jgi:hypothetical protein
VKNGKVEYLKLEQRETKRWENVDFDRAFGQDLAHGRITED